MWQRKGGRGKGEEVREGMVRLSHEILFRSPLPPSLFPLLPKKGPERLSRARTLSLRFDSCRAYTIIAPSDVRQTALGRPKSILIRMRSTQSPPAPK